MERYSYILLYAYISLEYIFYLYQVQYRFYFVIFLICTLLDLVNFGTTAMGPAYLHAETRMWSSLSTRGRKMERSWGVRKYWGDANRYPLTVEYRVHCSVHTYSAPWHKDVYWFVPRVQKATTSMETSGKVLYIPKTTWSILSTCPAEE